VLLRAFGPPGASAAPVDPTAVCRVAERLDLAARIGARAGRQSLESELGAGGALPLLARHHEAAARELALDALARELAAAAAGASVPAALVKFGALRAGGWLTPGSRLAADLDVLAPSGEAAERLQECLLARGFRPTGQPGHEHQLPSIDHPTLGAVEIHRHLPGVRAPGERRYATFEDLKAHGVLSRMSDAAGAPGLLAPEPVVLAAHAMAHGLAQHGWAPGALPPFRSIGDLVDLGLGGPEGDELVAEAAPWLEGTLSFEEVGAARELCRMLVEGRPEALEGSSAGALLGRHLLAGALDPVYRRSLALRRVRPAVGEAAGPRRLGHALVRGLFPADAELDLIYGPSRGPWRRARLRAGRPFDLAWRAARAGWSRVRLQGRSRHRVRWL
jgi:hypothetical protein